MMKSMLFRFFHSSIKQTMAVSEIRKRVGVNNVFCVRFGFHNVQLPCVYDLLLFVENDGPCRV